MEARSRNEKAARAGTLSGLETCSKLSRAHDSTPGERKRTGRLRTIEAEADTLDRAVEILKGSVLGKGPAVEQLGRALELVIQAEAERKRTKLRAGQSLAEMFPDTVPA